MPPFKVTANARDDWEKWKRCVENYMKACKITDDEEKYQLVIVIGGIELQDYFEKVVKKEVKTQDPSDTTKEIVLQYDSLIASLDNYFTRKTHKRFERNLFWDMKQLEEENFDDFVNRIRQQARKCEFHDMNDMVMDLILRGCRSVQLRNRMLSEEMTFDQVTQYGRTMEDVKIQSKAFEKTQPSEWVNRVQPARNDGRKCFNCNRQGHYARDLNACPAAKVFCRGCGGKGHFEIVCPKNKGSKRRQTEQGNGSFVKRVRKLLIKENLEEGVGFKR